MKKTLFIFLFFSAFMFDIAFTEEPKSLGKYKNWEAFSYNDDKGKVCFAQTIPTERSPKTFKVSEARLFVTFRKEEKIKNQEGDITCLHKSYAQGLIYINKNHKDFFCS